MEKHAYLIIAHNQMELLKTLIECLDYEYNDIYIHLDKKWKRQDFDSLKKAAKKSTVTLVKPRFNVKWGTYSLIECELALLKEASAGHYRYYHLMSGVDLPLKSPQEIHAFFSERQGTEFVHFDAPQIDAEVYARIAKYHFWVHKSGEKRWAWFDRCMIRIQKKMDRGKKYGLTFQKGAQWFSITDDLVQYVLSKETLIRRVFRYTCCSDEMFLQTIVANSPFIDRVVSDNFCDNYKTIQYCIDWKRGRPYTFREADYHDLMDSGMCFARKFDLKVDQEIVKKIKEDVLAGG